MKIQLLPSTFDENGCASARQHLSCFIIDDCVAIDAGSLAMAASREQKNKIRDIVLTHAHLDHIAGLPLFIDDLFASLENPIRIYAAGEVIEILESNIFNWNIYPRFSELKNQNGAVLEYKPFEAGEEFTVNHLRFKAIGVNHKVPSVGFLISDELSTIALTGDTASTEEFWEIINEAKNIEALFIECAFPNELEELAEISHHLTPRKLQNELEKFKCSGSRIFVINIKPMYYESVTQQIYSLEIPNLEIMEVARTY